MMREESCGLLRYWSPRSPSVSGLLELSVAFRQQSYYLIQRAGEVVYSNYNCVSGSVEKIEQYKYDSAASIRCWRSGKVDYLS